LWNIFGSFMGPFNYYQQDYIHKLQTVSMSEHGFQMDSKKV